MMTGMNEDEPPIPLVVKAPEPPPFNPVVLQVILAQHRLVPNWDHPVCTCGDDIPLGGSWAQHVVRAYERAVDLVAYVKASRP